MPGGPYPPLYVLQEWMKKGNRKHPGELRGWQVVISTCVLFAVVVCVLIARLWARLKLRRTAGLDDLFIVLAFIPTIGLAISVCLAVKLYGFDRHAWDINPQIIPKSRKTAFAIILCYVWSTGLTKISILLFYRRLSAGTIPKCFRITVQLSIGFVCAYLISCVLSLFLLCRPLNAFWNSANPRWYYSHERGKEWQCFDEGASDIAASVASVVQDALACGLPLILFWKLSLPRRQKIALGAVFGVGLFLCITGILRIYYTYQTFYKTYDVTWAAHDAWLWTSIEAHLAIICASAPALKIFFARFFEISGMSRIGCPTQRYKAWRHERSQQTRTTTMLVVRKYFNGPGNVVTTTTTRASPNSDAETDESDRFNQDPEFGVIRVDRAIEISSQRVSPPTQDYRPPRSSSVYSVATNGMFIGDVQSHNVNRSKSQLHSRPETPWMEIDPPDVGLGSLDRAVNGSTSRKQRFREDMGCF